MPAYLLPLDQGKKIVLEKAVVFIGRHPECDILLTQSRKISRKHCCIAQVNDAIVIRDLGSMNGVHVNGKRVEREVRLKIDDEVMIGDCRYVFKAAPAKNGQSSAAQRSPDKASAKSAPSNVARPTPKPVAPPTPEDDLDFPLPGSGRKKSRAVPADELSTPDAIPLMLPGKAKAGKEDLDDLDDLAVIDELDVVEIDEDDSFQELELVKPQQKKPPAPPRKPKEPELDDLEFLDDDEDEIMTLDESDEFKDSGSQVEMIPE